MSLKPRSFIKFAAMVALLGAFWGAIPAHAADNLWTVVTSITNARCAHVRSGGVRLQWEYVWDYSLVPGMTDVELALLNGQTNWEGTVIYNQTSAGIGGSLPGQPVWVSAPAYPIVYTYTSKAYGPAGNLTSTNSYQMICRADGAAVVNLLYNKNAS